MEEKFLRLMNLKYKLIRLVMIIILINNFKNMEMKFKIEKMGKTLMLENRQIYLRMIFKSKVEINLYKMLKARGHINQINRSMMILKILMNFCKNHIYLKIRKLLYIKVSNNGIVKFKDLYNKKIKKLKKKFLK